MLATLTPGLRPGVERGYDLRCDRLCDLEEVRGQAMTTPMSEETIWQLLVDDETAKATAMGAR